jgi:hypothetical protein
MLIRSLLRAAYCLRVQPPNRDEIALIRADATIARGLLTSLPVTGNYSVKSRRKMSLYWTLRLILSRPFARRIRAGISSRDSSKRRKAKRSYLPRSGLTLVPLQSPTQLLEHPLKHTPPHPEAQSLLQPLRQTPPHPLEQSVLQSARAGSGAVKPSPIAANAGSTFRPALRNSRRPTVRETPRPFCFFMPSPSRSQARGRSTVRNPKGTTARKWTEETPDCRRTGNSQANKHMHISLYAPCRGPKRLVYPPHHQRPSC